MNRQSLAQKNEKIIKITGEKYFILKYSDIAGLDKVNFVLETSDSKLEVLGIFQIRGEEVGELNLKIIHKAKTSQAKIKIISIIENSAHFTLNCQAIIESDAPESSNQLLHHSLLLDSTAKSSTTPQQEIQAENCQCSHDVTIENLNQNYVQYLTSKGISEEKAKKLFLESFIAQHSISVENGHFDELMLSF